MLFRARTKLTYTFIIVYVAWLNMPMMTRKRMTRRDILPGTTFTREGESQKTTAGTDQGIYQEADPGHHHEHHTGDEHLETKSV